MRIGIDYDDTLVDSFKVYQKYYDIWEEKANFKDIHHLLTGDWNRFFDLYWDKIYKEVNFYPEVKECLEKLRSMGHTLVLMSARFGPCQRFAVKQIKEANLPITEFYFTGPHKSIDCHTHNIDLMIDDSDRVIEELKNNHIKCLKKGNSRKFKHFDTWYDIVEYIEKECSCE